jgi:hypothetical protein
LFSVVEGLYSNKKVKLMKKHTQATFGILGLALVAGASQASADVESLIGSEVSGEISAGVIGSVMKLPGPTPRSLKNLPQI